MARLVHSLNIPTEALHLWAAEIDFRWVLLVSGLTLVIGDIAWRRTRPAIVAAPAAPTVDALPLPNKPSIAVLPFVNLSGDPGAGVFLRRYHRGHHRRAVAVPRAVRDRSQQHVHLQGQAVDVRQVARELGVHYVLEGSARKAGNRVRVNAQLVDAVTGNHLWAENFDRTLEDVFAVQQDVTRGIVRPWHRKWNWRKWPGASSQAE